MLHIKRILHELEIVGFADSVVCPPGGDHLDVVMQAYSIGSLRPNTMLLALPPKDALDARRRMAGRVETLAAFGYNMVIHNGVKPELTTGRKRIDIWWGGQRNGSLLALFAYLVSQTAEWANARLRMLQIVKSGSDHLAAEKRLRKLVEAARLKVDVEVILSTEPVTKLISETSSGSNLVLLGMAEQDVVGFQAFLDEGRSALMESLPTAMIVFSNGETDLLA
jgi:hypothetical protein